MDLSKLTPDQLKALNLSPEQLEILMSQHGGAEEKPQIINPMDGAEGYLSWKKVNGNITLFIAENEGWRPITQNELLQIASRAMTG